MIGFILYEAMDLTWAFGKTVFDIIGAGYRWYYHIPNEQQRIEMQIMRLTDKIQELEDKLDQKTPNETEDGSPLLE